MRLGEAMSWCEAIASTAQKVTKPSLQDCIRHRAETRPAGKHPMYLDLLACDREIYDPESISYDLPFFDLPSGAQAYPPRTIVYFTFSSLITVVKAHKSQVDQTLNKMVEASQQEQAAQLELISANSRVGLATHAVMVRTKEYRELVPCTGDEPTNAEIDQAEARYIRSQRMKRAKKRLGSLFDKHRP